MKKIVFYVLALAVFSCFMGCEFMAGVGAPENFQVLAVGRKLMFSWDEVPDADHYVIVTSGDKKKWEDYEVYDTKIVLDNWSNLLNYTEYTFCVCAVNNGIKGPASEKKSVYMPYGYDENTILYSKEKFTKSEGVSFTWDNIKASEHTGCPGIEYAVYRLEGTGGLYKPFTADEGANMIKVADHIKPSSDYANEKLYFTDKDEALTAGKVYQYFVQPYSINCNWQGNYIEYDLQGTSYRYIFIVDEEI